MHSSRIRTVRCSSHLGRRGGLPRGSVCLGGVCLPGGGVCLGRGVFQGGSAWGCLSGGVCPGSVCLSEGAEGGSACQMGVTPPLDRILDTRLWKHYLSATSFADGKKRNNCGEYCNSFFIRVFFWSPFLWIKLSTNGPTCEYYAPSIS